MRRHVLRMAASAERSIARLPESVATAAVEFITGSPVEAPRRVGKPMGDELSGWLSARLGAYRIVYWIDEDTRVVQVERIEHRADVYRPR